MTELSYTALTIGIGYVVLIVLIVVVKTLANRPGWRRRKHKKSECAYSGPERRQRNLKNGE